VLRTGEVEAQVALPGGGMLTVAQLGAGEMFGEMALLDRGVCTASVVACSDVYGWFIERDDFRAMVASREPAALEVQRAVTRVLSQKVRAVSARVSAHPAAEDQPLQAALETRRGEAGFEWRAFLPMLAFFQPFEAHEIDEFVQGCGVFELARGASLFEADAAAPACFLVIRGAVETFSPHNGLRRRIAIACPGELVGHLAVLEERPHGETARVRESACLMELPAAHLLAHYHGGSGTTVSLLHAIQRSLLQALARSNTQLTRLISHAWLTASPASAAELEKALHGQIVSPAV
jgi:CRP-like cAMP-binding protein